jgi:hypothetical protein
MEYEEDLQELLEKYNNWNGKFSGLPPSTSDLNDELFLLGYIKRHGIMLDNGQSIVGLVISEKGKRFLKNGGFVGKRKQEKNNKLMTLWSFIIVVITLILTIISTLKDCRGQAKDSARQQQLSTSVKQSHSDSLSHPKTDTL